MNNIKFNDWQEMALKKDTETIIKKMSTQEPIFYSLCWEIVIAVGSIIVDHFFDTQKVNIHIWIVCAVLAIIPPFLIIVIKSIKWVVSIRNAKAGTYNIKQFVDSFDNQICYWIMMCNSYNRLLYTMPNDKKSEKIFLYQEGCYYNNKSIHALYKMKPVLDKVFTDDPQKVVRSNLVATYRLVGLVEMLSTYQLELDRNINDFKSDPSVEEQIKINHELEKQIMEFVSEANDVFDLHMQWGKETS